MQVEDLSVRQVRTLVPARSDLYPSLATPNVIWLRRDMVSDAPTPIPKQAKCDDDNARTPTPLLPLKHVTERPSLHDFP